MKLQDAKTDLENAMSEFNKDQLDNFLGVVRKYMQVRGPMSQKELAELTEVGVSTMSRFLTQKTNDLNPQLIAKVVAKLQIPLHEIIDFVEEDYADKFIRLVKFYKAEDEDIEGAPHFGEDVDQKVGDITKTEPMENTGGASGSGDDLDDAMMKALGHGGTAQRNASAQITIGGKKRTISFSSEGDREKSLREKIESLSPRQKAYMSDFLNLDMEGRDLIVDIGNNLFRYFRQKGVDY